MSVAHFLQKYNKEVAAKGEIEKEAIQERKFQLQQKLRDELGLVIDMPKPGGSGTVRPRI